MRAVLDTNVLISALFWRGVPYECLLAAHAGLYELVVTESILTELRDRLVEKFEHTGEEAEGILQEVRRHATIVEPTGRSGWVAADPDDDKFVDAALVAGVAVIVSGDHHLLQLAVIDGIPVVTPRQFLVQLGS